jgi:hypothetical protein
MKRAGGVPALWPALSLLALTTVALFAAEAVPRVEVEVPIVESPSPLGTLLYDQTDSPAGAGFASQRFEPGSSQFDCRAADDFTVPVADVQWDLSSLVVPGAYFPGTGPTPLADVEFFVDAGGQPGAASCSYIGLVAGVDFIDDGTGNLSITLPSVCALSAGDYWVSVRADMDQATGGQWRWQERSAQTGAVFAWENPGDGFGTGCTSWTPAGACGANAPDLLFSLSGVQVPVELQSISID